MVQLGAERQRADELARQMDELRAELAQRSETLAVARRPWWKRLFGEP